jgi:hypothetical protein
MSLSLKHGGATMILTERQRRYREIAAELTEIGKFEVIDLKREAELLQELDQIEVAGGIETGEEMVLRGC